MSFSAEVKKELCRADVGCKVNAVAECYGTLLFCNTFSEKEIRIVTGSAPFADRLPKLFKRAFEIEFDEMPKEKSGKRIFILRTEPGIAKILDAFGCNIGEMIAHHLNLGVLENEGTEVSFLRGAFLAGGSVTDPEKGYHLELVTGHHNVSREVTALLMDMGFEPGRAERGGNCVLYFKQSTAIEDFLTTVGAPLSAMVVMSAKIEKDMTNSVNRKVNCDTANVSKTVEASAQQIAAIRRLRERGEFDALPDKLKCVARLREENPELALSELAATAVPPMTKSCVSHRLRKIMELSKELPNVYTSARS